MCICGKLSSIFVVFVIYNISRLTTQITTAQKATKNGECLLSVPSAIDIKTSKENTPVTQCNRTAERKCFFTKRQISAGCLLLCRVLPGTTEIGSDLNLRHFGYLRFATTKLSMYIGWIPSKTRSCFQPVQAPSSYGSQRINSLLFLQAFITVICPNRVDLPKMIKLHSQNIEYCQYVRLCESGLGGNGCPTV